MTAHSGFALVLLASLMIAGNASAQQSPPPGEPGIWIADANGLLQEVQPASETFLRRQQPAQRELVLAVETFASTATAALSAGELATRRIRSALAQSGTVTGPVDSRVAYVEARYRERILAGSWETPRRIGFDAAFVMTLEVPAGADIGRLVDAAMGAGATRVLTLGPASTR